MQIEEQSGSSPALDSQETIEQPSKAGETEDSLLSVVQSVSEQSAEQSITDSQTDSPPVEGSQSTEAETEPSLDSDTDFSKLPDWKNKNFRGLVGERNHFKKMARENEGDAKQYRDIQAFMDANGLTADEVAKSLDMAARVKRGDPTEAYELMKARTEELALATGKKLPTDLEDRIEQGYIDRETAQELHQHRVKAERQAQIATSQLERRSQQDAQQQTVAMAQAVQTWEQSTKAADPDFELKVELVKDRVRAAIATNGMPKTADEALKLSKDAYESVTQVLRRAQGTRQSMRPAVGGKVNGSAAPEPRNLLDVIRQSAGA